MLRISIAVALSIGFSPEAVAQEKPAKEQREAPIDFARAKQLLEKERRGLTLTPEEQRYLERAKAARRERQGGEGKPSVNFTPLCDMSADAAARIKTVAVTARVKICRPRRIARLPWSSWRA